MKQRTLLWALDSRLSLCMTTTKKPQQLASSIQVELGAAKGESTVLPPTPLLLPLPMHLGGGGGRHALLSRLQWVRLWGRHTLSLYQMSKFHISSATIQSPARQYTNPTCLVHSK